MSQLSSFSTPSSGGNVVGPGSSTTGNFASFADTSGTVLADSGYDAADFQPVDATLTSISSLGTAADRTIYTTGVDTWAETPLTSFARTILDDANAAAVRTTIGAGTGNGDVTGSSSSLVAEVAIFGSTNGKSIMNGSGILAGNGALSATINVGSNLTWTIKNTSTTPGAGSLMHTESAISDSYYRAVLASTNSWAFGNRQADSSAFYLTRAASASATLGSTLVMKATTAGEITQPLQPAFLAKSAGQTNVTGDGTLVNPVTFTTEIFDQNADYDTATSTFTAPVTGRYQLNVQVVFSDSTSATSFAVLLSTSNRTYTYSFTPPAAASGAGNAISFSHLCDMDAADTATVIAQVSGIAKAVEISPESYFSGFLAC